MAGDTKTTEQQQQRVAIIGAGVAGCAMAGALRDYGIDFVVYDKNSGPGGLWADNYPGAAVQATFELYEYPCKKYPESLRNRSYPPAPTAAEVCTYLDEYLDEKQMRSHFQFKKTVKNISCRSESDWVVELDDSTKERFTFVIMCSGLVSVKPNMIDLPGSAEFVKAGGTILHSSERRAGTTMLEGKRVLVIGNGKSAVDAALAAAEANKKCSSNNSTTKPPIQLARRQIWYVPRYILGFLQYKWAFHTRIGSLLQPAYYETPALFGAIHRLFFPVKWLLWRVVELLLLGQYRIPYRLWPSLLTIETAALDTSLLVTDEIHLNKLRNGDIDMRIGTISSLKPGKVVFNDGSEENVDVIIQATGWSPGYTTMIDQETLMKGVKTTTKDGSLDVADDGLWLYRNVLPSGFRGLAFVGSNTLTFINIYTSYIQAYWLAGFLANERAWPDHAHMAETVEREKAFKRKLYPSGNMRGASVELYMQDYHDVLFKEMKARKPFHWMVRPLADLFVPVLPAVMKGCLEPTNKEGGNDDDVTAKSPLLGTVAAAAAAAAGGAA